MEAAAKDIINSIAERDIYTGDQVEIVIITRNGVSVKREAIRRDWKINSKVFQQINQSI